MPGCSKQYVTEMGYTTRNAAERVTGGMSRPPQDFVAWLDRIRAELKARSLSCGGARPPT
jgi:hypothetical protein